ncbi:hypothetical protein L1987_67051 [Smallanthus sonchifolius]|uniref:Uncharacterized protein n=1 Tax=Smallanthus sonchifolius TaxID=185202 RepID=A0ACB9BZ63_9ASTR|nr:hypothetical protein L1987_67051 [Smallanthus sonchifolius]
MGEYHNYCWSCNGKLQPPPSHQAYNPTFLATPPPSSILNPPYLFGSSLLEPNALVDHHHHENQDFPPSWSHSLLNGLAIDQEQHNLGGGHVGKVKHAYLENQQSRQLYYSSNEEDLQAANCTSSWSSQLNPVPCVGLSSIMSLNNTMFDNFSSKIDNRNQYSSQYDDTSTASGASKKPRFQSFSNSQPAFSKGSTLLNPNPSKELISQVRKEKSERERISTLHQLVSPFGKTDRASVLYEAAVQIKFFVSQIEALSSPYMNSVNNVSGATRHQHFADGKALPKDLSSRGLCLVPVTCMDHVDTTNMTSNGAEFWMPALGGGYLELGFL